MINIGSRSQVMRGTANKTSGGLTKSQLKYNKQGKIVSKKASALAKKNNRLVKAGYITRKGQFGCEMRGGGETSIEMAPLSPEAVANTQTVTNTVSSAPPQPKVITSKTIDGVRFKEKNKWVPVQTFKIFAPPYQEDVVVIKVTFKSTDNRNPIEFKLDRITLEPYPRTVHNKWPWHARKRFDIYNDKSQYRFSINNNSYNIENMERLFEKIKTEKEKYRDYYKNRGVPILNIFETIVLNEVDGVLFKEQNKWVPVQTFKIFAPPYSEGKDVVVIRVTFEPSVRPPIEFKLFGINPYPYPQTIDNKRRSRERFDIHEHKSQYRFSINNNSSNLVDMKNLFKEIKRQKEKYKKYYNYRKDTLRDIVTKIVESPPRNITFERFKSKGKQNNVLNRLIIPIQTFIINKYKNEQLPTDTTILEDTILEDITKITPREFHIARIVSDIRNHKYNILDTQSIYINSDGKPTNDEYSQYFG